MATKSLKILKRPQKFNALAAGAVGACLVVVGFFVVASRAASGTATLSLSPSTAIVANGSSFSVQVYENSGTAPVNAVQANLTYPSSSLTLTSIDSTTSAFPLEAQQTGGSGTITIARAINGGTTPLTGSQLVATLNFTSQMTSGSATVNFTTGSAVVSSVDNTGLILTTTGGTYQPDTVPPSVPAGLHSTGTTGTSISVAWSASTDNVAVTGYNVYRDSVKVGTTNANGLAYTDTGLVMGTTHTYAVTAFDAAGNESAQSTSIQATIPDTTPPTVPTGVTIAAPAYNKITLNWNSSTDTGGSGLAGYKIYRNGSTTPLTSVAPSGVATVTYSDTTVAGSTNYVYTVAAFDGAGNVSAQTPSVNITTPAAPDTTPPTTPTNLSASATTLTTVTLTWTASTDNVAVAGYQVFRNGTQIGSPTTTTYTDSGLSYGTNYSYSVKAVDTSGNLSTAATLGASTLPLKVGDLNADNQVNVFDLSILLSDWQMNGTVADLNHDGVVNIFDLSILISNWGK